MRRLLLSLILGALFHMPSLAANDAQEYLAPLLEHLQSIAGPSAVNCGIFQKDQDSAPGLDCARDHFIRGEAFWFGSGGFGDDSYMADVIAKPAGASAVGIWYDSNRYGGPALEPYFQETPCVSVEFKPGEIQCVGK